MSIKALWRLAGMVLLIAWNILLFRFASLKGMPSREARMLWLHQLCGKIVRNLGWKMRVEGELPAHGLLVTNHLSYLDILFLASATPCVFVSKIEVRKWPLFGLCADLCGTIYVDRASRSNSREAAGEVAKALAAGIPVLVFPEGTSTDGSSLLPFHPTFFEAALQAQVPVVPGAIAYHADGIAESDLCYYGDIHFAPHLMETLGREGFTAHIRFGEPQAPLGRRESADRAMEQVAELRSVLRASEVAEVSLAG